MSQLGALFTVNVIELNGELKFNSNASHAMFNLVFGCLVSINVFLHVDNLPLPLFLLVLTHNHTQITKT